MNPSVIPDFPNSPQEIARAFGAPRRPPRHHHRQPRRRRARGRARPQSVGRLSGRARAEPDRAGAQAAGAGRLCRHRREGETGGDLGARQGRRRCADHRPRQRTTFRRACANSSAASACRTCRTIRTACPQGHGHNIITGQGSGFFISGDGYAVTNNHVVDKAESVQVTTDDGKTHTAKVIGTDPRTDLALIKVDGGPFPYREALRQGPAHRRLGARGRQSVRPRRHRDRRHRLGARPRHRRQRL